MWSDFRVILQGQATFHFVCFFFPSFLYFGNKAVVWLIGWLQVRETLLRRHRHLYEKNKEHSAAKLPIIRSLADIGRNYSTSRSELLLISWFLFQRCPFFDFLLHLYTLLIACYWFFRFFSEFYTYCRLFSFFLSAVLYRWCRSMLIC